VKQILSQEEVDALLTAVNRGALDRPAGAGPEGCERPVTGYDFRNPNRLSKDQLRVLESMHEAFGRLFSTSMSALIRGQFESELRRVDQVRYGEFVASLRPPTCVAVFAMDPLKGGAAFMISAEVLFQLIDRLLGGSGLLPVRLREFTEVEQGLIARITSRAMVDLRQAWQHVGTFGFRVANLETNPQFVQLTAPSEVVIVVSLSVRIGETAGEMTLALPHLLLEAVMPKLDTHRGLASSQRVSSREERDGLRQNVLRLGLTLRGVLGEIALTVGDLLELEPGDVLSVGRVPAAPATVEVEGVPRFTARPGIVQRRTALQILSVIPRGEAISDSGVRGGLARVHTP
jgi:flagellar motor switch protein FliM